MHQAFFRHVDCAKPQPFQPPLLLLLLLLHPLTAAITTAAAAAAAPAGAFHPRHQQLYSSIANAVS